MNAVLSGVGVGSGLLEHTCCSNFSIFSDPDGALPPSHDDVNSQEIHNQVDLGCLAPISVSWRGAGDILDNGSLDGGDLDIECECCPFSSTECSVGVASGRLGSHRGYVIDHSVVDSLCTGPCSHVLAGCRVQLNRAVHFTGNCFSQVRSTLMQIICIMGSVMDLTS